MESSKTARFVTNRIVLQRYGRLWYRRPDLNQSGWSSLTDIAERNAPQIIVAVPGLAVGALCERPFFWESTRSGRSQTAPTAYSVRSSAVVILVVVAPSVSVLVVFMFNPTVISVPVTHKIHLSLVTGCYPAGPCVRWWSPIAFMPLVTVLHCIPVTIYPDVFGTRLLWRNVNDTGRRWRTNSDPDGDLSTERRFASR